MMNSKQVEKDYVSSGYTSKTVVRQQRKLEDFRVNLIMAFDSIIIPYHSKLSFDSISKLKITNALTCYITLEILTHW